MPGEVDGELAVRFARSAVYRNLRVRPPIPVPPTLPATFDEPRGVFVTWYRGDGHDLRGCIGFPEPRLPLAEGLREASVAAALEDPRFPPVDASELPSLVVEVSVLSGFLPVPLAERPDAVRVGVDGLTVEAGRARGLLLPQVAPEQGWSASEFLDGACVKAGLAPGAWRSDRVVVRRFGATIFRERSPWGPVARTDAGGAGAD